MNDRHTRHSLKPLWSVLRYPSTGWVSEMLARQLNRAAGNRHVPEVVAVGLHPEPRSGARRLD